MGRPPQYEIEKHAKDEFAVAQERIALAYAEQKRRELIQVSHRGNIGGYVPTLTDLAAKHVRRQVIALADAYVKAFDLFGMPCDLDAEKSIEVGAQQMAAGAISAVCGELDLIHKRINQPLNHLGHPRRAIERSMQSAVKAGKLRLKRQRIKFKYSEHPLQAADGNRPTQPVPDKQNGPPANDTASASTERDTSVIDNNSAQGRHSTTTTTPPFSQRPLDAIRDDEARRVEAKKDVDRTLESYVQTIPRQRDLDLNRLAEIWGEYAATLYDSLAESYRGLSVDSETLFGAGGVLAGGQTFTDVEKHIKRVRIRRPAHWPDPELSRPGDHSPEVPRELRALLVGECISFASLYDEQWFWSQISVRVAERVHRWKDSFAGYAKTQFANTPNKPTASPFSGPTSPALSSPPGTAVEPADAPPRGRALSMGDLMRSVGEPLTPQEFEALKAGFATLKEARARFDNPALTRVWRLAGQMETVEEFKALLPSLLRELGSEIPDGVLQPLRAKPGRPASKITGLIHAEWVRMGKPQTTAAVCDRIANAFFSGDLKGIDRGSVKHKAARERVRQAINRFERRLAT